MALLRVGMLPQKMPPSLENEAANGCLFEMGARAVRGV
jgi:hypothetical protein